MTLPAARSVPLSPSAAVRKKLSSAGSGGRNGTAEMLKFCADNSVVADIETLPSSRVNVALDRLRQK
jgi:uncharacterized zinc-type alcohol dehydrogenase-like protein